MKCDYCGKDFEERKLHCSHDIPKYLGGTDLDGRHWLCEEHHKEYDILILSRCLKYIGETLKEGDEISWMKELSRQPENLKKIFRSIAYEVKREFFEDGRCKY